jgi:[ribosomal protein S5]-alanine N-acetyltransferase
MSAIILETERLILREFVAEDVDALSKILSDPVTMRFYPAPLKRNQVEEWIARNQKRYQEDGYGLWAMLLKLTGELMGDCGLTRQIVEGAAEIEIGYHVRRDFWGCGYAPEAAAACRDWGFKSLEGAHLISLIRQGNVPSRRVAEKVGMMLWKNVLWREIEHWVMKIDRPSAG